MEERNEESSDKEEAVTTTTTVQDEEGAEERDEGRVMLVTSIKPEALTSVEEVSVESVLVGAAREGEEEEEEQRDVGKFIETMDNDAVPEMDDVNFSQMTRGNEKTRRVYLCWMKVAAGAA